MIVPHRHLTTTCLGSELRTSRSSAHKCADIRLGFAQSTESRGEAPVEAQENNADAEGRCAPLLVPSLPPLNGGTGTFHSITKLNATIIESLRL